MKLNSNYSDILYFIRCYILNFDNSLDKSSKLYLKSSLGSIILYIKFIICSEKIFLLIFLFNQLIIDFIVLSSLSESNIFKFKNIAYNKQYPREKTSLLKGL